MRPEATKCDVLSPLVLHWGTNHNHIIYCRKYYWEDLETTQTDTRAPYKIKVKRNQEKCKNNDVQRQVKEQKDKQKIEF